jgi:hypothetical protein
MGTVCLAFAALQNQLIDQLIAVRDQLIAAFWPEVEYFLSLRGGGDIS